MNTTNPNVAHIDGFRPPKLFYIAKLIKERRYNDIKATAVRQVQHQLLSFLDLLRHGNFCNASILSRMEMPHNMFSWSLKDCLKRREFTLAWRTLVLTALSRGCLERRKSIADFRELAKITLNVFEAHHKKAADIVELLSSPRNYTQYESDLRQECDQNEKTMITLQKESAGLQHMQTFVKRANKSNLAEIGPRYKLTSRLRVAMAQLDADIEMQQTGEDERIAELERTIQANLKQLQNEMYCSNCSLNFYQNSIMSLRGRVKSMGLKYETNYDDINFKVTYGRKRLDRMEGHKAFLLEHRDRMREELMNIKEGVDTKLPDEQLALAQIDLNKNANETKPQPQQQSDVKKIHPKGLKSKRL